MQLLNEAFKIAGISGAAGFVGLGGAKLIKGVNNVVKGRSFASVGEGVESLKSAKAFEADQVATNINKQLEDAGTQSRLKYTMAEAIDDKDLLAIQSSFENTTRLGQTGKFREFGQNQADSLNQYFKLIKEKFGVNTGSAYDTGKLISEVTENRNKVTGVTSEGNISKITLHNIPDKPGIAAKVFKPLSEAGINVDVIVQNISRNHKTDLTFTVKNEDLTHALNIVQNKSIKYTNYENISSGSNYAKISIIGTGIQNSPGYAAKFFDALFESKVNIEMITTSDIRITCLINERDINKAVNKVHDVFGLY